MAYTFARKREAMLVWFQCNQNLADTSRRVKVGRNTLQRWCEDDDWCGFAERANNIALERIAQKAGEDKATFVLGTKKLIDDGLKALNAADMKFTDLVALIKLYFDLKDEPLGAGGAVGDDGFHSIQHARAWIIAQVEASVSG